MLIILAGMPGSGKTTIARLLARRIGAVHVRIDTIEDALRGAGLEPGPAGYLAAYGIAADNLALGHSVIADCVNALQITRRAWQDVARSMAVEARLIQVICSDEAEHRYRVESRAVDVPGALKLDWHYVQDRSFEAWETEPLVLDTAGRDAVTVVNELVAALGSSKPRALC